MNFCCLTIETCSLPGYQFPGNIHNNSRLETALSVWGKPAVGNATGSANNFLMKAFTIIYKTPDGEIRTAHVEGGNLPHAMDLLKDRPWFKRIKTWITAIIECPGDTSGPISR